MHRTNSFGITLMNVMFEKEEKRMVKRNSFHKRIYIYWKNIRDANCCLETKNCEINDFVSNLHFNKRLYRDNEKGWIFSLPKQTILFSLFVKNFSFFNTITCPNWLYLQFDRSIRQNTKELNSNCLERKTNFREMVVQITFLYVKIQILHCFVD